MVQFVQLLSETQSGGFSFVLRLPDVKFIDLVIMWLILRLFPIESSIYPSATASDRHPPCLFIVVMLAPESARSVADVLRKVCPVYESASSNFKYL